MGERVRRWVSASIGERGAEGAKPEDSVWDVNDAEGEGEAPLSVSVVLEMNEASVVVNECEPPSESAPRSALPRSLPQPAAATRSP